MRMAKTDSLVPDKAQPRKTFNVDELAETLKSEGIINPILVKGNVIIDGERRWRAAKLIGLKEVPVIDYNTNNPLKTQLIVEFHKENVSPLERARALKQFIDIASINRNQASKELGISHQMVGLLLSIVEDSSLEKKVEKGDVDFFVAQEAKQHLGREEALKIASMPKEDQPTVMQIRKIAKIRKIQEELKGIQYGKEEKTPKDFVKSVKDSLFEFGKWLDGRYFPSAARILKERYPDLAEDIRYTLLAAKNKIDSALKDLS